MDNYYLLLGILFYLIILCLLVRWINKLTKDSKIVLGTLYSHINSYFFIINEYIARNRDKIEKFDDLIEVIYAKKKRFLAHKTHNLVDQYELFLGLEDSVDYLSSFSFEDLRNHQLQKECSDLFSFLFSARNRQKVLRGTLAVLTLGIGIGFVSEPVKL